MPRDRLRPPLPPVPPLRPGPSLRPRPCSCPPPRTPPMDTARPHPRQAHTVASTFDFRITFRATIATRDQPTGAALDFVRLGTSRRRSRNRPHVCTSLPYCSPTCRMFDVSAFATSGSSCRRTCLGGYMWDVQATESERSRRARPRARWSSPRLGRKARWYVPASLITDLVGAGVPVALMLFGAHQPWAVPSGVFAGLAWTGVQSVPLALRGPGHRRGPGHAAGAPRLVHPAEVLAMRRTWPDSAPARAARRGSRTSRVRRIRAGWTCDASRSKLSPGP